MPEINGISVAGNEVSLPRDIVGTVTLLLLWTKEHGQVGLMYLSDYACSDKSIMRRKIDRGELSIKFRSITTSRQIHY